MGTTSYNVADALGLVQDFWAPVFMKELRESTLLAGLVNPTYGNFKKGDTVKVSEINKPSSVIRTIGTNADSFETNIMSSTQVDLKITKRAVSAYEFEDLAVVLSQLEDENSEIRESLLSDVRQQINDYLYSIISPSTATPDHVVTGVTDFNLAQLSATRLLAGTAKWPVNSPWYLLADPSYYTDMLDDTTLGSSLFGASDSPMIQGRIALKRMNFNILEDNSLATDKAYAFLSDFLLTAIGNVQFKISDLHAQKKFGFIISADVTAGAIQSPSGSTKVISIGA